MSAEDAGWYFAYGANMSDAVLTRRHIRSLEARPGLLRGYARTFQVPGMPLAEPRFATVVEAPDAQVHGVLHLISSEGLELLDRYELNQERFEVQVDSPSGTITATTYRSRVMVPEKGCSRRYKRLLVDGGRTHGLPPEAIAELEALPVAGVPGLDLMMSRIVVVLEAAERAPAPFRWLYRLLGHREP